MDDAHIKLQKEALRTEAKRARGLIELSAQDYQKLSKNFMSLIPNNIKKNIAVYYPVQREISTHEIIDEALNAGHHLCLPVIEENTRILKFGTWDGKEDLEQGRYNIAQPIRKNYVIPDIIAVPLLAFDRSGYRLGYGGGYYDATINAIRKTHSGVMTVGIAYAQQACLFPLPRGEHDVRLDYVVTEQNIHKYKDIA